MKLDTKDEREYAARALRHIAEGELTRVSAAAIEGAEEEGLVASHAGTTELSSKGREVLTELELGDPNPGALTEVELPAWNSSRYYLIEADGKALITGFDQKPAAIRNAERAGLGVFDTKESEWVVAPHVARREVRLGESIESLEAKLKEAERILADIRAIHRGGGR